MTGLQVFRDAAPAKVIGADERALEPRIGGLLAGTGILTPAGYRAIETLRPGDNVATLTNRDTLFAPIVWIGRRRASLRQPAAQARAAPIRIARDAITDGMPRRDLLLAPQQVLYVTGVPHMAASLVNGTSIRQEAGSAVAEYWGIALERHDVIVAEGLPLDTLLDDGARVHFRTVGVPRFRPDAASVQAAAPRA